MNEPENVWQPMDPATVISNSTIAKTVDGLAERLPTDLASAAFDTPTSWWATLGPATVALLTDLVQALLPSAEFDDVFVELAQVGYRLGWLALSDPPRPEPPPNLAPWADTISNMEFSLLYLRYPHVWPDALAMSERALQQAGLLDGDAEEADDAIGAGSVSVDFGWLAAMIEHDLRSGFVPPILNADDEED